MPTVAYSGRPFFRSAWSALRHGRTNMDVPISIGVAAGHRAQPVRDADPRPARLFRRRGHAAVLPAGRALARQHHARPRAQRRDASCSGRPRRARWCSTDGRRQRVDRRAGSAPRHADDRRRRASGWRRTGSIERGASSLDLSLLTGESAPRPVADGGEVHAGTLNLDAPLVVRVTAAGPDTIIADIARLMEQAGQGKSRYVRHRRPRGALLCAGRPHAGGDRLCRLAGRRRRLAPGDR